MKDIYSKENSSEKMMEKEQEFLIKEMMRKEMLKAIETKFRNNDEDTLKALKNLIYEEKPKTDIW